MPADGAAICQRAVRLKADRANHEARWEELAKYLAPSRQGITGKRSEGAPQMRDVTDSTTMMAAELMAMFLAGHLINPAQQWLGLQMADPVIGKRDDVREWLEDSRDRMLVSLAASAFYAEGPESLIDHGGFGTGCLVLEERPTASHQARRGFRGLWPQAVRTGRFLIAEGVDGRVDTLFREVKLTARTMQQQFDPGMLPPKVTAVIQSGKPDEPFDLWHAIYPRPLSEQRTGAGASAMPYASCWVEQESKTLVRESGYRVFPAAVPRYHRTPGEQYGRGRGDIAYPDCWTLNTSKLMGLEDHALKMRPPILVRSGSVIGSLRLTPAGPTVINTHGMAIRDVIAPFETGSNPQLASIKEEELRKSIRQIFFVDQILQLMEVNKSEMTAFEFAKKLELLFSLIGPVYGRLEWEWLHPIVDVTFDNMLHGGAFAPPPPALFESDGQIDAVFQNPIARAQRAGDAEAVSMLLQDLTPLAAIDPAALQRMLVWLDPDETMQMLMRTRGVPAKASRSEEQVLAILEQQAQQAQQQQVMHGAMAAAEAAGKAAPLVSAMKQGTA